MQVSVETTSELTRKMIVQVPEEKIQEQVNMRLKSMAVKVKLDGFRPGKAPQGILQKKYGKGVREEVVAELIQTSFNEAVLEEKLRPVASPFITHEPTEEGEGLKYVADFEVMPQFVLYPLENMQVERYISTVTEHDLEDMLLRLREQRITWRPSDNPVALGDRVAIHYRGQSQGEIFTKGEMEKISLVLGSKQVVPGFEEELIGTVVGSHKIFQLELPEAFGNKQLAGKTAEFSVSVVSVEASELPDLDAEFLQSFGIENGDAEVFRAEIKSNMEREVSRALSDKNRESVMEALLRQNEMSSLPSVLVNEELKSLINHHQSEAKKLKQAFDDSAARDQLRPSAIRRVALGLLINRIVEIKQVTLDKGRLRRTVEELAVSYEQPEEMIKWIYSNRGQLEQVQSLVIENQVVDLIYETAKVNEKMVGFKELMQPFLQAPQG